MSYDESYIPKVDVEGMISVDIYIYKKMEGDYVCKFHLEDRKGVEQRIMSWCQNGDVLFLKLLSTFPSTDNEIT